MISVDIEKNQDESKIKLSSEEPNFIKFYIVDDYNTMHTKVLSFKNVIINRHFIECYAENINQEIDVRKDSVFSIQFDNPYEKLSRIYKTLEQFVQIDNLEKIIFRMFLEDKKMKIVANNKEILSINFDSIYWQI